MRRRPPRFTRTDTICPYTARGRSRGARATRSWIADDQQPLLGHVLDRVAHAFAAEARVLDAAVGHVVDAEAEHVADDHAADLEPVPAPHRMRQPAGEHPTPQAADAALDRRPGLGEATEPLPSGHRAAGTQRRTAGGRARGGKAE